MDAEYIRINYLKKTTDLISVVFIKKIYFLYTVRPSACANGS